MTGQVNFNSHSDLVVTAAVGLVNALTPGEARGRDYLAPTGDAAVQAIAEALGTASPRLDGSAVAGVVELAADLRLIFQAVAGGDVDAAAEQVNRILERSQAHPTLQRHDGEPWHLHYHGRGDDFVENWAAGCATGLAIVIGSELYDRLGVCTAPHCDRVYVDVSRNGQRRFCSTACQNRVKAAAYRARMSTSAS